MKQLLHHSSSLGGQTDTQPERENPLRPHLGTINIIFAAPGRTGSCPSRIISVARLFSEDGSHELKRARLDWPLVMGFLDEDKIGTIQPHDDALVIILRIGGYDVKRVMDQGSAADIMYPDLFKGLNLRAEDLTPYNSPLVSFEGKVIIPKGQIASAEWFGDDGGRLYSGGCIFSLHSNYCQNLASYFRSSFIHSASEDQVPIRRTDRGDIG